MTDSLVTARDTLEDAENAALELVSALSRFSVAANTAMDDLDIHICNRGHFLSALADAGKAAAVAVDCLAVAHGVGRDLAGPAADDLRPTRTGGNKTDP